MPPVILMVPPPDRLAVVASVTPSTVIGGVKVRVWPELLVSPDPAGGACSELLLLEPPPPKRRPMLPASMADCKVVVLESRRSCKTPVTLTTCPSDLIFVNCASVNGSPPPSKPRAPAGDTVIMLPIELLTESILVCTPWRATSIASAKPMDRPSIMTIEKVRTTLRNALRTPRLTVFILCLIINVILR